MPKKEKILSVKESHLENQEIIGHQESGGIVNINNQNLFLRHQNWRYNQNLWGRDQFGFSKDDTSELGFHLVPLDTGITLNLVHQHLDYLKQGYLPPTNTKGVEIEGSIYDQQGNLTEVHDQKFIIENDKHPELLKFTLERATNQNNGFHLQHPNQIAVALGQATIEGIKIAEDKNCLIIYTSVPEAGNFQDGEVTKHPYLALAAPRVLKEALINQNNIPSETLETFSLLGIDILKYLERSENLNWPVQALHVHSGLPTHEDLVDPRIAYVSATLRLTELSKAVSFMLYNTSCLYSYETNLKDVRSIIRRLVSTTHDSQLPSTSDELISETLKQLETGLIHSPSRYPATGQHDRVRSRMEKSFQTVESIDAPMCPDLRMVIAWVMFQSILDTLALEALSQSDGNEIQALNYLQEQYGTLLSYQPSLGQNSSYEWDLRFNQNGYNDPLLSNAVADSMAIINHFGNTYPAIKTNSSILIHALKSSISDVKDVDLARRLGLVNGKHDPSISYKGIVTDHKLDYSKNELLLIQHEATKQQAVSLTRIRDDQDLLSFMGIT